MTASEVTGEEQVRGCAIEFDGLNVDLVLSPPDPGAASPTLAGILDVLRSQPLKSIDQGAVERALEELTTTGAPVRVGVGVVALPPRAQPPCAIVVSNDRLAAYAVPVPMPAPAPPPAGAPEAEGGAATEEGSEPAPDVPATISAAELRDQLEAAGVKAGLFDDVLGAFGEGAEVHDIVCVARGSRALAGIDAWLDYHFDEHAGAPPQQREDGSVDHRAAVVQRSVAEGTPLITRHPPVPATAGLDVLGKVLQPPTPKDVVLARLSGKNTTVVDDTVVAAISGRPVRADSGAVSVLAIFEVRGDLDYSVGNIDFPGDVVVHGEVKSGFTIVAEGSVVIHGLVEHASIKAGGNLAVTGVVGEHPSHFEVGGDLSATYLHTTEARVGGTVTVSGEILNCTLEADCVRTGPRGRIVGGHIVAAREIDTGTLGSREGRATFVEVRTPESSAVVRARRMVHEGVTVQLGDTHRTIRLELEGASFWNAGGVIFTLRPDIDVAAATAEIAPVGSPENAGQPEAA